MRSSTGTISAQRPRGNLHLLELGMGLAMLSLSLVAVKNGDMSCFMCFNIGVMELMRM